MNRIKSIYLETTIFNYYYQPERDAYKYVLSLFDEINKNNYDAFSSRYVVEEIMKAPQEKKEKMIKLLKDNNIKILQSNEEANILANKYVEENIIPKKFLMDALHIAIASYYNIDMIISLNFKHIVKVKTVEKVCAINALNGYNKIGIYSPMEVVNG